MKPPYPDAVVPLQKSHMAIASSLRPRRIVIRITGDVYETFQSGLMGKVYYRHADVNRVDSIRRVNVLIDVLYVE